jgi:hypothetical protein
MGGTVGIVHSDALCRLCARLCIRYLPIGIGEVHGMVMHASLPSWLGQSRKLPFSAWILTVLGSLGLLSSRPENVL